MSAHCPCCGAALKRGTLTLDEIQQELVGHQRVLFNILRKSFGSYIPRDRVLDAMYSGAMVPENAAAVLNVVSSQTNQKLKPYNLHIVSLMGRGMGDRKLERISS